MKKLQPLIIGLIALLPIFIDQILNNWVAEIAIGYLAIIGTLTIYFLGLQIKNKDMGNLLKVLMLTLPFIILFYWNYVREAQELWILLLIFAIAGTMAVLTKKLNFKIVNAILLSIVSIATAYWVIPLLLTS